ncbi:hypothetical protein CTZ27_26260 [Streptomyces griseocarneus]|nr:hypothetical protein CTZ27_26260 [Streptomyces griseocarneus]
MDVRTSTIDAIEARVDRDGGATLVGNSLVRDLEEMERLRLPRLHAVQQEIMRRDLRTFPEKLLYSDEVFSFVVYRPKLLVIDAHTVAREPGIRKALTYVMDALGKDASGQFHANERRFRSMVRKLASAHPEVHWQFKQHGAA